MTTAPDPSRRPPISREGIIDAAIAVIDDQGVDGLTMRRLGTALGADPMAAYLHFANKAELLDAVVEHQAAKLFAVPAIEATDMVELIIGLARHYRAMLLEHPNLAPLIASRPLPQDTAANSIVDSVNLLRLAGFTDEDIPIAFDATVTYSFGFVLHEAERTRRKDLLGVSFEEQQQDLLDQLAARPDDTTTAQAVIRRRVQPGAADEGFTTGLRAMVLGWQAGLGRAPDSPST